MSDDPTRKDRRLDRKEEPRPKHDQPCERVQYETPKARFDAWMDEAKDG
jgi:hypothetical protein